MCHPKPGTFSTTRMILKKPTTNRIGPARPRARFHTVTVFIESDLQLTDSERNISEGGSFWTMAYPADSEVERRVGSFASHASTFEARSIRMNGMPLPLSRSFCRLERERVGAIGTTLSCGPLVSKLNWGSKVPPRPFEVPARLAPPEAAGRGILRTVHRASDAASNPASEVELRRLALSQTSKSSRR